MNLVTKKLRTEKMMPAARRKAMMTKIKLKNPPGGQPGFARTPLSFTYQSSKT